jgi:hypothetical protein
MQLRTISLDAAGDDGVQEQPIDIDTENVLLVISTKRDVIETSRNMDTRFASHTNLSRQQADPSLRPQPQIREGSNTA